jgi:hypothetical protein
MVVSPLDSVRQKRFLPPPPAAGVAYHHRATSGQTPPKLHCPARGSVCSNILIACSAVIVMGGSLARRSLRNVFAGVMIRRPCEARRSGRH